MENCRFLGENSNAPATRDDVNEIGTCRCEEERLSKVFEKGVRSCPDCLELEILADYGNRAGLFVTELWESPIEMKLSV